MSFTFNQHWLMGIIAKLQHTQNISFMHNSTYRTKTFQDMIMVMGGQVPRRLLHGWLWMWSKQQQTISLDQHGASFLCRQNTNRKDSLQFGDLEKGGTHASYNVTVSWRGEGYQLWLFSFTHFLFTHESSIAWQTQMPLSHTVEKIHFNP